MGRELYCHFSFRRPKGKNYGLFCCAFYTSQTSRKPVGKFTKALKLWEDQQYVCAIQSFSYALDIIWEGQKELKDKNVDTIYLVTDNSTLAKWIENPNRNKEYAAYMKRAYSNYTKGKSKELIIRVGLANVVKYEKSYKYCNEAYLINKIPEDLNIGKNSVFKVNVQDGKNIDEILNEINPKIDGIDMCSASDNGAADIDIDELLQEDEDVVSDSKNIIDELCEE